MGLRSQHAIHNDRELDQFTTCETTGYEREPSPRKVSSRNTSSEGSPSGRGANNICDSRWAETGLHRDVQDAQGFPSLYFRIVAVDRQQRACCQDAFGRFGSADGCMKSGLKTLHRVSTFFSGLIVLPTCCCCLGLMVCICIHLRKVLGAQYSEKDEGYLYIYSPYSFANRWNGMGSHISFV